MDSLSSSRCVVLRYVVLCCIIDRDAFHDLALVEWESPAAVDAGEDGGIVNTCGSACRDHGYAATSVATWSGAKETTGASGFALKLLATLKAHSRPIVLLWAPSILPFPKRSS